jgi:uroporphyrinogen-III decarboxylase
MTNKRLSSGRELALRALSGEATERVPVGPLTWGFDYYWKVAGLESWQLACGDSETWHMAHIALLERHRPDLVWYSGAGTGTGTPTLVEENQRQWIVRDGNSGTIYGLLKDSLTLYEVRTGFKECDPLGDIRTAGDADRLVPEFTGWGETYLNGLRRLIDDVGNRALVLPHHSPGYICACYALGFQRAMETLVAEPELFTYIADRYAAGDELRMRELAEAGAQVVYIADGWASCDIISPRTFEQFALPYQRSIAATAHRAGLYVILWNEGNVLPILDLEATLSVDAFGIEQPRKGVDLSIAQVRGAFGPHRCLIGNLDSEGLLLERDPQRIARFVEEQVHQSGIGNPFIMSTGSPLPSNIDPTAVDMMIQATRAIHL